MSDHRDEPNVKDWLRILPAASLARHVGIAALRDELLAMPRELSIEDIRLASEDPAWHSLYGVLSTKRRRTEVAGATRYFQRCLRTRSIEVVRPRGPSWVVPDSLGFRIEGASPSLARRRLKLLGRLDALAGTRSLTGAQRRAVRRVHGLLDGIEPYPTWLYWYSASTVRLARSASSESLQAVNREATLTLNDLVGRCTISTWEERLGVVTRRIPVGVMSPYLSSRRGRALMSRMEKLGIHTIGGVSVVSTDSLAFLSKVRVETMQSFAGALRGARLQQSP